jgi:hypothetical protein
MTVVWDRTALYLVITIQKGKEKYKHGIFKSQKGTQKLIKILRKINTKRPANNHGKHHPVAIQINGSDIHSYKRHGLPFGLPIHHFHENVLMLSITTAVSVLPFSKTI